MKTLQTEDGYGAWRLLKEMVGTKVKHIYMNEDYLRFIVEKNNEEYSCTFSVYGDCCSMSWFHDFYGVKKLLNNTIVSYAEKSLEPGDEVCKCARCKNGEFIQVYGYQFFTEGENGEQTSVFSFRNSSNGYYGGNLEISNDIKVAPELFDDLIAE